MRSGRNRRAASANISYKEEKDETSEDETNLRSCFGDEADSGSDFENSLRIVKRHAVLEPPTPSSVSSENTGRSKRSKKTGRISLSKRLSTLMDKAVSSSEKILTVGNVAKISQDLNLSESSSDDDPADVKPKQLFFAETKKPSAKPKESPVKVDLSMASQLENLANSYTRINEDIRRGKSGDVSNSLLPASDSEDVILNEVKLSSRKRKSKKAQSFECKRTKPASNDEKENDIKILLSMGEGVSAECIGDSSRLDDETVEPSIERKSVEITVQVSDGLLQRRRKNKKLDMEAWLKRKLEKAQRDVQLSMHKTHFLCLLGHLRYVNSILGTGMHGHSCFPNAKVLLALTLSMIPPVHAIKSEELTVVRLASFANWFKDAFPAVKNTSVSGRLFEEPPFLTLQKAIRNSICLRIDHKVFIFVLAARSLGWNTRLVLNFNLVPIKREKGSGIKEKQLGGKQNKEEFPGKGKKISNRDTGETRASGSPQTSDKYEVAKPKGTKQNRSPEQRTVKSTKSKSDIKKQEKSTEKSVSKRETRGSTSKGKPLSGAALREAASRTGRTKSCRFDVSDQERSPSTTTKNSKKAKESFEINPKAEREAKGLKVTERILAYWAEVYVNHGWVTVDVENGKVNCAAEMEGRVFSHGKNVAKNSNQFLYVIGANVDGSLKDTTKRYTASKYSTVTRKARVAQEWIDEALKPFQPFPNSRSHFLHLQEDSAMEKSLASAPLPSSIGGFKGHPLYVLKRHLLKFEVIYPPDPPTLGFIRGEAVYARECVHTCHCRVTWLKEGRTVKLGEEPYKVVKARPKYDRMTGNVVKDQPLDVFGKWQTEIYVSPPAVDGKVPRNEYGNVDMFKPWMLPKGTVHIPIQGLNRTAKKLDIDCAAAMVGWEFSGGGGCHPVFDGFVVCEEFQDTLMDAWNVEIEEKAKKDAAKREQKVYENWRKLIKGALVHAKIKRKYLKM